MATKENLTQIKEIAEEFTTDLGLSAKVVVREIEEDDEPAYLVSLEGEDLGVLIGYHGETLNALQLILSLIITKKLGDWIRIVVDAGDWRARRFETIEAMANRAADKAVASGREVALPQMSSSDRRMVHIALKSHAAVTTESTGEEGYRRVIVRPHG